MDADEEIQDSTLSELSRYLHHDSVLQMGCEILKLPEAMVYNLSKEFGPTNGNFHILMRWKQKYDPHPAELARVLEEAWKRNIHISSEAFKCIGIQHPDLTNTKSQHADDIPPLKPAEPEKITIPTATPEPTHPRPSAVYPGVMRIDDPGDGRKVLEENGHTSVLPHVMKGQVDFRGRLLKYELKQGMRKFKPSCKVTLCDPSTGVQVVEGDRLDQRGNAMRNALYKLINQS